MDYSDKATCTIPCPPIVFYLDFCGPCIYRKSRTMSISQTYSVEVPFCHIFDERLEKADDRLLSVCQIKRCQSCLDWEEILDEQEVEAEFGDFGTIGG